MLLCLLKPLKETLVLYADGLPTLELTSYALKLLLNSCGEADCRCFVGKQTQEV